MIRVTFERVKSFVLILLIVFSFVQVGILWSNQNFGFPFRIFAPFFSKQNTADRTIEKENYFIPYRIIAVDGYGADGNKWIIGRDSPYFSRLWEEAGSYLGTVAGLKPVAVEPADKWYSYIDKKSFIFEYQTNMRKELLADFLRIPELSKAQPSGIYKMMICWSELGNNELTIYINDTENVYKYKVKIPAGKMDKQSYDTKFQQISKDTSLRTYSFIKDLMIIRYIASPDILCISPGSDDRSNYAEIPYYNWSVPDKIMKTESGQSDDIDNLMSAVLGEDKNSYDKSQTNKDTLTFKNSDNLYKIYSNTGLMKYDYINGLSEKGTISDAFNNAYDFIYGKAEGILAGCRYSLILSGIKDDSKDHYEFTFDYMEDGIPVFFDAGESASGQGKSGNVDKNGINPVMIPAENESMMHAITIYANGSRVTSCQWHLVKFYQGNKRKYDVDFLTFLNDFVNSFDPKGYLKTNKGFSINNIEKGYLAEKEGVTAEKKSGSNIVEPVWVAKTVQGDSKTVQGDSYIVPMPVRKP